MPVFKYGNKMELGNYRPISLISNIAKIFEKIVHGRMFKCLSSSGRINDKQFGFLKNKSSAHALDKVLDSIYNGISENEAVAATFM